MSLVPASCPFCSAATAVQWGSDGRRTLFECPGCGIVFYARPIEYPADYGNYYPYLKEFDSARFGWELGVRRAKYRYQLRAIRALRPDARTLLDVGAGPGYFCKVASEEGWEVHGVESSPPAIEAGAREFGVRYVSLDEVAEGSMDAVTCFHVLEHMEDPSGFLRKLHSKLRRDGILVLHVPNLEPLTFAMRNFVKARLQPGAARLSHCYYPEHLTGFNPDSLPRVVARHGFEAIRVRTVSMWSAFYDPFFLMNYFRDTGGQPVEKVDYPGLVRHAVRCVADGVGVFFGRGDWIVGHFRAVSL
jgi:SAM-dependent methyltransferase